MKMRVAGAVAVALAGIFWAGGVRAEDEWAAKPRARELLVLDAASGKPIVGVEVSAVTPESEVFLSATGAEGLAAVPKAAEGWQFLSVHMAGFRTQLVDVQDVERYFAGPPATYSKYYDGFAGTVKLEHDE